MTHVVMLGIDLGKNSCSVAGVDEAGRVVLRRRLSRDGIEPLLKKLPRRGSRGNEKARLREAAEPVNLGR